MPGGEDGVNQRGATPSLNAKSNDAAGLRQPAKAEKEERPTIGTAPIKEPFAWRYELARRPLRGETRDSEKGDSQVKIRQSAVQYFQANLHQIDNVRFVEL